MATTVAATIRARRESEDGLGVDMDPDEDARFNPDIAYAPPRTSAVPGQLTTRPQDSSGLAVRKLERRPSMLKQTEGESRPAFLKRAWNAKGARSMPSKLACAPAQAPSEPCSSFKMTEHSADIEVVLRCAAKIQSV